MEMDVDDKSSDSISNNNDAHSKQAPSDMDDDVDGNDDDQREDDRCEDEEHDEDMGEDEDDDEEYTSSESEDDYEDSEESEYEVEELEYIPWTEPEQIFKLKLYVSKIEEFEKWLDTIKARITLNGKYIGFAIARYIHRERIRTDFRRDMEGPSQDMSALAFGVFDRYGYLQTNLKEHPVRRGTGVWGSELDTGPLLLIECFEIIDKEWRRKGLGETMVNALIQKAQKRGVLERSKKLHEASSSLLSASSQTPQGHSNSLLNLLVIPGSLTRRVEQEAMGKSKREKYEINCQAFDTAVAFCRSLGFRRIGFSKCFGLSFDPDHKSHTLSITEDFDLPLIEPEGLDDDSDSEIPSYFAEQEKLEKSKRTYPLHHATLTLSDHACVEFYIAFAPKDRASWKQVDNSHNTVLHVAARRFKLHSIQWLMDNAGEELISARDRNGYTPLESLQDLLEVRRTQSMPGNRIINEADRFSGFSGIATACLCMLSGLGIINAASIESLRLKYGCTCGKCIAGFISPRMRLALVFQAEVIGGRLNFDIDDGPNWCDSFEDTIAHVDQNIRPYLHTNKALQQGFANTFKYIASCLNSDIVPTRENVLRAVQNDSEAPPVIRDYFEQGETTRGKVEGALRVIFEEAKIQDEKFGNGVMEAAMGTELSQLEICRNDQEYGFVASECGVPKMYCF
jgi:GNAT superfamily N-acetyltransferase